MQVITANDVKVYNLSAGKNLPEWISDRKKRTLLKNDIDLRRRIELLQDFTMPAAATGLDVSSDGQYIFAAGVYKPRVRCYDVNHLSMKFERCVDSEIVDLFLLSEDYTKFVMLMANRQLEFHSQSGFYYRTRVPRFGRSLAYHTASCDLYVTSASSEVYRLNLDLGQFLPPLTTKASGCNVAQFSPHHQLLSIGTEEGTVECWDPRSQSRVGELSLAMSGVQFSEREEIPGVTALQYRDAMNLAVGTASGQILLYDLRSPRPHRVKDHMYSSPIHSIYFQPGENLVISSDSKILKIWNENDGSTYTSIEPEHNINKTLHLPGTGMVLMATEDPKMLAYFIPSVGVAPPWCSFLDTLTEELEEDKEHTVYEDFKFVTTKDLEQLGLSHLVGTNLMRAYMHGYFMDMRLYHKAKAIAEPFAYETYKKQKIKEKIEEARAIKIHKKKLPKVNRLLAEKMIADQPGAKSRNPGGSLNPLGDQRFEAMFTNVDFELEEESEEFQRLHPILSHKEKRMKIKEKIVKEKEEEDEVEGRCSGDSSSDESDQEVWREIRKERREKKIQERDNTNSIKVTPPITTPTMKHPKSAANLTRGSVGVSLGQRLSKVNSSEIDHTSSSSMGSKEHVFTIIKKNKEVEEFKEHKLERRRIQRSARSILPKKRGAVYWRGRRVK